MYLRCMVKSKENRHPNYFEAILQLRDCNEQIVGLVQDEISRGEVKLTKTVKVSSGFDYYLSEKQFAIVLGKKLLSSYGGYYNVSASLWGEKDGKKIYRVTVLFRCCNLKKDDLVEYGGEKYRIKMVMPKEIMLQEINSGTKIHLKYREMKSLKKVN